MTIRVWRRRECKRRVKFNKKKVWQRRLRKKRIKSDKKVLVFDRRVLREKRKAWQKRIGGWQKSEKRIKSLTEEV